MFSLVMSSVPTPRKAPPSRKNEKLRAPGSCEFSASAFSSARKVSACGVDASWAYTIPLAIAPAETINAMIKANFLLDMSKSSGKIYELSRARAAEVPKFFTDWSAGVLARRSVRSTPGVFPLRAHSERGRSRSSHVRPSKIPDSTLKDGGYLIRRDSSINFPSIADFQSNLSFGVSVIEVGHGFRDGQETVDVIGAGKHRA